MPTQKKPHDFHVGEILFLPEIFNILVKDQKKKFLVISVLITAFVGKKYFSGSWEEDLDNTIRIFETLAPICELD